MSLTSAVDRYLAAWNDHDPQGVVDALAPDGTYEDPTTGGPIGGAALAATVAGLLGAYPDLRFDEVSSGPTSETSGVIQWLMCGTNTGPLPGGPSTGATVALPGVDLVDYDPGTDRLTRVVGYFDTATMLSQLGLQAHVTPADKAPNEFGYSVRVDTGREEVPGAFSVTWIDIDEAHHPLLLQETQAIVVEQLGNDEYLGSCFAVVGRRHYTFSAWRDVDAARRALRGGRHGGAIRATKRAELGDDAFGVTSIWSPAVMNGIFRVGPSAADDTLDAQWL